MYYEERMINGVLHYRTDPAKAFQPYTLPDLSWRHERANERIAKLEAALKEVVRTLRYQVKLAVRVGGEVALYEGNATAWEQARAALREGI